MLPLIDATQAMHVIFAQGLIFDANQVARLVVLSASLNLILTNAAGTQVRVVRSWPSPTGGQNFIIGAQGIRCGSEMGEFIYGTDYADVAQSIGGVPGRYLLQLGADITNPGIIAAVTFSITALIEIYQRAIPAS